MSQIRQNEVSFTYLEISPESHCLRLLDTRRKFELRDICDFDGRIAQKECVELKNQEWLNDNLTWPETISDQSADGPKLPDEENWWALVIALDEKELFDELLRSFSNVRPILNYFS